MHIGMKFGPRRSTLAYANEHRSWELQDCLAPWGLGQYTCQGQRKNTDRPSVPGRPPGYLRSISMFSFLPLLETAIMMPNPINITIPINVQAMPMLANIFNFQSAARTPMMSMI